MTQCLKEMKTTTNRHCQLMTEILSRLWTLILESLQMETGLHHYHSDLTDKLFQTTMIMHLIEQSLFL